MSSQLLILSLETASLAGSISISRGAEILATSSGNPAVSHSNTLILDINRLLSQTDLSVRDIDLFAVACGPGSFTGLRIGIATVKALATTLSRPCVGVPTLEAVAHAAGESQATVTLLPAGRGEVFVQMFSVSGDGVVTELDQAGHLSPTKAVEKYIARGGICWAGHGAQLYSTLIQESAVKAGHHLLLPNNGNAHSVGSSWRIAEPPLNLAQHVASLARYRVEHGTDQTPNSLRAIYVRPSDAEMKS